ncbi:Zinc finger (C3HC4-type RING finger) family protein [Seminavis robusta]|uniref:Zinc finger (C3HC4-type RING finger) family protein n=1 Tax=Seminavis robusta TaxID=568900 RepID=A0A9N8EL02_9STRA|nr:Zinc finger (C3HC4-type RING finger) family protein [Seminavis robusta]|eukprot:Sro1137_g245300.1 Zinc finger (C3HC4-type RING finger) family protein (221) ;mRNA; f:18414-19262
MSTNPGSFARDNDTTYLEAIAIAGIIMGALVALVILRLFVNLCIDVVILGDLDSARRSLGSLVRRFCPWWHRRTQPEDTSAETNNGNSNDREQQMMELGNTPRRFQYSLDERKNIIATILQGRTLKSEDIEKLKSDEPEPSFMSEGSGSGGGKICSICLVEFAVGDTAVTAERCSHTFHHKCIVDWLGTHQTDCPYCRTQMVSPEALETAASSSSLSHYL